MYKMAWGQSNNWGSIKISLIWIFKCLVIILISKGYTNYRNLQSFLKGISNFWHKNNWCLKFNKSNYCLNLSLGLLPSSLDKWASVLTPAFPQTTVSWALCSCPVTKFSSAASVYAGAGHSGSWISMSHSTSVWSTWESGGLTVGMVGGLQAWGHPEWGDYATPEWPLGLLSGEGENPEGS